MATNQTTLAGEIAYQLTKRLVIDISTARAAVDAAFASKPAEPVAPPAREALSLRKDASGVVWVHFDAPGGRSAMLSLTNIVNEKLERAPGFTAKVMSEALSDFFATTPTPPAVQDKEAIRAEILNTPEVRDFATGVVLEALHQRERWGSEHDEGKTAADWFWLVGYLAGKALHAQTSGNNDKALHHTISTAAALANWHAAITGKHTAMRPGIDRAARGDEVNQK